MESEGSASGEEIVQENVWVFYKNTYIPNLHII